MAATTAVLKLAAILIGLGIFLSLPACALSAFILISVGRASEVLPVVRVHTGIALVLLVREGTPNRLKVEEVEVYVALIVL